MSARSFALVALVVSGCGVEHAEPSPVDAGRVCDEECGESDTAYECPKQCFGGISTDVRGLRDCVGSLDRHALGSALDISFVFASQMLELREAVGLSSNFANDAYGVLVTLAQAPAARALSAPFGSPDEHGTYRSWVLGWRSEESHVDATLLFGADYLAGKRLEPIAVDFFRTESFLGGAVIAVSGSSATVHYDSTGPLVELLGLGVSPPNPFTLTDSESTREISRQLLDVHAKHAETTRGVATSWSAHVRRKLQPNAAFTWELEQAQASTKTQTLVVTHAAISGSSQDGLFVPGLFDSVDFQIDFEVSGGPVPHKGAFRASLTTADAIERRPSLVLSCD